MTHMVKNSTIDVKVKSKTEIGLVLGSVDEVESTKAALCSGVANCVAVLHSGGRRRLSESGTFSATFLVTIVHEDSESVDSNAVQAAVSSRVPSGATVSTQPTSSTTTEVTVVSTGTKSDADTLIDTLSQSVADAVATEMGIDASQVTVSTPLASFPPPMPPPTSTIDDDEDDDNTMQIVVIASIAAISLLAIALSIYLMMRQRQAQREENAALLGKAKKTDVPAQQLASASGVHFVLPSIKRA